MAEINQESGVFGGISFENNMSQSGVVENAGTIRNEALPVKTGFWQNRTERCEILSCINTCTIYLVQK